MIAPTATQGVTAPSASGGSLVWVALTADLTSGQTFDEPGGDDTENATLSETDGTITFGTTTSSPLDGMVTAARRVTVPLQGLVDALVAAGDTRLTELAADLEGELPKWTLVIDTYAITHPGTAATGGCLLVGWGQGGEALGALIEHVSATEWAAQPCNTSTNFGSAVSGTHDRVVTALSCSLGSEFDGDSNDDQMIAIQCSDGGVGTGLVPPEVNTGGFAAAPDVIVGVGSDTGSGATFSATARIRFAFVENPLTLAAAA